MERLWAPWRMTYIRGIDSKEEGCVFCNKPRQDNDRENLLLFRGKKCFVLMNLFPYNNGHLMIIPYLHCSDILDLDGETSAELWNLTALSKRVLSEAMRPEGFNIGMNLGRGAGAGIDQHIHMHIVPRWNGDTNFMPVLDQTRVISQALEETYEILHPLFKSMGATFTGSEP